MLYKETLKNPNQKQIATLFKKARKLFNKQLKNKTLAFSIYKSDTGVSFKMLLLKTPTARTNGVTSYCTDGKHILMFDFDGLTLKEVIIEMYLLRNAHKLSQIYILKNDRKNSFGVFCLDKFKLYEAIEIISSTSADKSYKRAPLLYGLKRWVYRFDKKGERAAPKLCWVIEGHQEAQRERSNAHRLLFNLIFKGNIKTNAFFDKYNSIDLYSYLTSSKIRK
jgi:hypothetical protein